MKRDRLVACFLLGLVLAGCAAAPRIISMRASADAARPIGDITDYPTAFQAIASVMARDLRLPVPNASLYLYQHADAFELGLVTELRYEPTLARDVARFAWGVGGSAKVLVNEAALVSRTWAERVRFLAHEFTHTVQYDLSGGRRGTSDQWLREGHADWVSYRVLEALGLNLYVSLRDGRLAALRRFGNPTDLPVLGDMVTFQQWVALRNRWGAAATYGQALLATEFPIERRGHDAVVRYFRLFGSSDDRLQSFQSAFGEDFAAFERAWREKMAGLATGA